MDTLVDVVDTGTPWVVSRSIEIEAPAASIFDLVADPRRHQAFDGSGTLRGSVVGPERLSLGAKFRMHMHMGLPYQISNTVKEFEEGRLIAWAHMGGHRWRYELEPLDANRTRVTETFDATYARSRQALRLMDAYRRNGASIEETLVRLKRVVEDGVPDVKEAS